jgi:hypothetical protein
MALRASMFRDIAAEIAETAMAQPHQGFDAVEFCIKAEEYRLVSELGVDGFFAVKEAWEFETTDAFSE